LFPVSWTTKQWCLFACQWTCCSQHFPSCMRVGTWGWSDHHDFATWNGETLCDLHHWLIVTT
jgi:hypothetical protein